MINFQKITIFRLHTRSNGSNTVQPEDIPAMIEIPKRIAAT
jgi:hypothetical protein